MAVVRQLMVRAGADFSAMRQEMARAQHDLSAFKAGITKTVAGIATALATMGAGAGLASAVKEAMTYEASLMQLNRMLQSNAGEFKAWADKNAAALGMGRVEAVKYGATFSNIISTFEKDTGRLAASTKELITASAVTASATGRTMEDTMERIRSGMLGNTEAIEDLGIFVGVSMIESTEAFRKFAGDKSWEKLDFQTQQQIRLLAILEQATAKYGSALADNTFTRQAQFTAQLKNTQLALGQAFLPIYNAILPALTRFATALATVMNVVAQFSQALFGKASNVNAQAKAIAGQAAAVTGVGDAYEEAGKAAKKAAGSVAGFDEVNILKDPSEGAGADDPGAGGSVTAPAMPDMGLGGFAETSLEVSEKVQKMVEKMKKAFRDLAGDGNIKKLSDAYDNMKNSFKDLGTAIENFVNNPKVQAVGEWIAKTLGSKFMNARISDMNLISGAFESWAGSVEMLDGLLAMDFDKFFGGFEKWGKGTSESVEGFIRIFSPETADKFHKFREEFGEAWKGMRDDIKKYGDPAKMEVSDFGEWIKDTLSTKWEELRKNTSEKWEEIKNTINEKWVKTEKEVSWESLGQVVANTWAAIKAKASAEWESIKQTVSDRWNEMLTFVHWDDIKAPIANVWTSIKTGAGTAWTNIRQTVSDKWEEFKTLITWDSLKGTVSTIWTSIKTTAGISWDGIKKTVSDKWGEITKIDLSGITTAVSGIWNDLKIMTKNTWDGIGKTIKDSVNTVISTINKFIDQVNGMEINIPKVKVGKIEVGGGTIGMPKIPKIPELARGGIVDGRTNMGNYVAGEAGPEMIVPLENTSFTDKVAAALGTAVMTAMTISQSNSKGGNTVINIDGREVARALQSHTTNENKRLGSSMIQVF